MYFYLDTIVKQKFLALLLFTNKRNFLGDVFTVLVDLREAEELRNFLQN